jgi:crotonobetainyl-CoA:carnitine CoA-transferase CaiB-like acyl-CoA transferase
MVHITGYGRGGPKSDRPGYGTLAEAMSGFAQVVGQPDGPPTLPPFMLADGVAAQAATYATMMALYHRDVHGGEAQLVDVNLIEPLARIIESSTLWFDQLGIVSGRVGNRLDASAPRNAYRTADDKWLAISSASPTMAMQVFEEHEVTAAPVYDAEQLLGDEHLRGRGTFVRVDDDDFGPVTVQSPVAQLSATPGRIDHLGRPLGADNDAVYGELLGLDAERLAELRTSSVI